MMRSMGEFVRLDVADGIGTIRLDRPKMNAISFQVQGELREAAAEATERDDVRAVVLYGGEKVFAGGDNAKLGQPEILLGIIPGAGGTQRLARLVGPSRAKDLIFTGRFVKADEALAIGLVDRVLPKEQVYDEAGGWAKQFTTGAALALRAAKESIDRGLEVDLDTGLEIERAAFAGVFATEDSTTGMRSFVENGPGKASFEGR